MSETPKWTPGPWELPDLSYVKAVGKWDISSADGSVATVYGKSRSNLDANARLIAAAPELYDDLASKECPLCHNQFGYTGPRRQDRAERNWQGCPTCAPTRALLTKARGTSQEPA